MLTASLAPYLLWAKTRQPAAIDLAGSNLLACTLEDLPGARDAVDLTAPNDNGFPPLVAAIAAHTGVAADRVATAAGCSGANFIAIAALVGPGDDVLIERPTYDPLIGACRLIGAAVHRFDRRVEDGWRLDLDAIHARLTPRTRLIVVTTPHNPSGAMIDRASLAALGRLAADAGAHVLVDEVYLDAAMLVGGDPATFQSVARIDGPFVSTTSLTKSYGLAGIRCGWVIAPPDIAERVRRTRDVVDNAGTAPSDRLGAFAFTQLARLAGRAQRLLGANLDRARHFLADRPELELATPPCASVIFPRLAGVADAEPFLQHLLTRHGVAVAPGRFFEAPAHFRVSLAGRTDLLEAGLAKIGEALSDLKPHRDI